MFVREQKIKPRLHKRKLKEDAIIRYELEVIESNPRVFSASAYNQIKK